MQRGVTNKGECLLQCCDDDTCNNGCLAGPSTVATTILSTKPHFNIPTPPPHVNLTTPMPTTTKVFLIPTTPKPTTTLSTPSTTPSTTTTTTTPTTPTTPTTHSTSTTTATQATTPITTKKPIECASANYMFDNGCYIIPRQEMSFREAEKFCALYNASLVHVESAKENDFLKQTLRNKRQPLQYWIGIMDEIKEGEWLYYDDHTPATFFDWMPGEPDGKQLFDGTSEADCAVFDPFADFQWRDEECSPYQFSVPICEKRIHPRPNTTQPTTQTTNFPVPGVTSSSQTGTTSSSKPLKTTTTATTQHRTQSSSIATSLISTSSLVASLSSVPTSHSVAESVLPTSSPMSSSSTTTTSSIITSPSAAADSSSSAIMSSLVTSTSTAAESSSAASSLETISASPLVVSHGSPVTPSSSLVTSPLTTVYSLKTSPAAHAASSSPFVASSSAAVSTLNTSPTVTAVSSSSATASSLLNSNITTKGIQLVTKTSRIPTNLSTKSPVYSTSSTSSISTSKPSESSNVSQTAVPSTTKRVCPSGAWEFEDSCYLHIKLEMSFGKAIKFCTSYNAHLVHVDSARENEYLKRKLKEINNPVQYWIGIMDEVKEDVWVYYDNGQNATYFDWSPGEPDNQHEFDGSNIADCAVFDPFMDYHWKDEECSPYHYSQTICEL